MLTTRTSVPCVVVTRCPPPGAKKDLVYAVPNKGNAEELLNAEDMAAGVVLFERGEVRAERATATRRGTDRVTE